MVRSLAKAQGFLPGAVLISADMISPSSLSRLEVPCDVLVHLAATSHAFCRSHPTESAQINIAGTEHLITRLLTGGLKHVVFVSTIHVYGTPEQPLITESSPTKPASEYAAQRLATEELLAKLCEKAGIGYTILRLSNAVGWVPNPEGESWNLIGNFICREAARSGHVRLNGDGEQERNFIGASDVVKAILHCIDTQPRGVFNLGSPHYLRVADLVRLAQESFMTRTGRAFTVEFGAQHEPPLPFPVTYDTAKLRATGINLNDSLSPELDFTFTKLCGP